MSRLDMVYVTLKYMRLTLRHKIFVFQAGLKTKAPIWRLIIHDWTKFTLSEAPHYGRQFFGDKGDPLGFSYAWLHHQRMNPHHWEYWIPISGHNKGGFGDLEPLPMPEWAVREMVADWMGASRAYEGRWPSKDKWPWLEANLAVIKQRMHPVTRERVDGVLESVGLLKAKGVE